MDKEQEVTTDNGENNSDIPFFSGLVSNDLTSSTLKNQLHQLHQHNPCLQKQRGVLKNMEAISNVNVE